MRVLHLLSSSGFHGAEAMVAELVHAQRRMGIDCYVGVFDNAGRGDRSILERCRADIVHGMVFPCASQFDRHTVAGIRRYVVEHDIDVVHSHKYKTTAHALLACRRRSTRIVATCHNWLTDTWRLRLYGILDRVLARYCDAVVAVSGPVEAQLRGRVLESRLFRIGNGVDVDRFYPATYKASVRARLGLAADDRLCVGFVGRLTAAKGVCDLISAVEELQSKAGPRLLIVGDGPDRTKLEQNAASLVRCGRAQFLGTRDDVDDLYRAMDLLVLPSYEEASPMVILEAFACGIPVIATAVGDVPHIVDDPSCGWVIAPGDIEGLARAIAVADCDRAALAQMGMAARQRAVERYSSARMALDYASVYRVVLAARVG